MIEKMKQWLQALEYPLITSHEAFDVDMAELLAHRAIESLRQTIEDFEKQKPMAWKHYTKPLERRLQHLETKENQNSFDKHEAAALRHVLDIVTQPKREPLTDEIPKGVLLAISNAGLTLLKTQHGYELRKLDPIKAANGIKENT